MKVHAGISSVGAILFVLAGSLVGDMPPQPQVEFTKGSANSFNAEWTGIAERTYFFQWSRDLINWDYAPFMAYGIAADDVHSYGAESDDPVLFVRLKYADIPTTNAQLADFDLDGIGNLAELNLGTDPLDADSDRDGIPDGMETANNGDPLSDTDGDSLRASDSDGDGLNDAVELTYGTSPTLWDSDGDGFGDAEDAYPLDPARHVSGATDPGDTTKPVVTLETPVNAVVVSGP